ncbi:MAG: helix-turn-helix transcriptional regulator [Luteolibacter sp.]
MLSPVFQDLLKPQWRLVIEMLKRHGGMPVSDLARLTGSNYMTVKTHCDQLAKAGYLSLTRLPRTQVGRPEFFYSLSAKADALFPGPGTDFTLGLLDALCQMQGGNAADKLMFQYFHTLAARLEKALEPLSTPDARARKLAKLRVAAGHACEYEQPGGAPARLVEWHNPLGRILERYPHAVGFEQRMIEQLLGTRVIRKEIPGGRETMPQVVFELA